MKESILHFIWQNKLFYPHELRTTEGARVEVINVGNYNRDAGPDFFNAKIKIEDTLWVGNIEIHNNSGDWYRHKHDENKAYDSVILHIVNCADQEVFRTNGELIPQMELKFPAYVEKQYLELKHSFSELPCEAYIHKVPSLLMRSWQTALLTERLMSKVQQIESVLVWSIQDFESAFYVSLARSFGFGTNSDAFERLAMILPMNILLKHKDNLFQLEALLFGQAGLLEVANSDLYSRSLKNEYEFLKQKYSLHAMDSSLWKLLRLRPQNFPHVRLAQFASLFHHTSKLFSKIIENMELESLQALLQTKPSEYWRIHYVFGRTSTYNDKVLGVKSIQSLIINAIVPVIFVFAQKHGNQSLIDRSLNLLEQIPPEENRYLSVWKRVGISMTSAYETQAMLQLKRKYCDERKCLSCRIGHKVLSVDNDL